ncbi:hypothetical protein AX774_g1295 [Zancudomyces culisetae]|uniref:Cytochrome c oxidase assembly factor 1 n=1 Tax=Zancudomyces culisetae TaxID=1213189 RepID=A0A1R1PW65_ZANCU|nr:hypothetical protein AX774_g1295 [Zancudomyces culisetae]|eukprot:OMH85152.1 hypothetical protein AX774_g1295 [Zancudomyces culisetae]
MNLNTGFGSIFKRGNPISNCNFFKRPLASSTILVSKIQVTKKFNYLGTVHVNSFHSTIEHQSQKQSKDTTPLVEARYENPAFAIRRDNIFENPQDSAARLAEKRKKIYKYTSYALLACLSWAVCIEYFFNDTRMTSSAVTAALFIARNNEEVVEAYGHGLDFPNNFYTKVYGVVNNLKGNVDVYFKVVGSNKREGTLYLKCHRKDLSTNVWTTDSFYILTPEGQKIPLEM